MALNRIAVEPSRPQRGFVGQPPGRHVQVEGFERAPDPHIALEDGTAYVIRQDDGQPLDPDNWGRRDWPTIRTTAKLPKAVTLHVLRHSFGSLLLADGAPIKHVAEQMGHANVEITLNVYQHVLRASSATATRYLDKYVPAQRGAAPLRLVKTDAA